MCYVHSPPHPVERIEPDSCLSDRTNCLRLRARPSARNLASKSRSSLAVWRCTHSGERIKDEPAFTIQDLLQESPGASFKQGNGEREYRIKSANEPHARVARESELIKA